MEDNLDQEQWRRLRQEARQAAAAEQERAEQWAQAALNTADPDRLTQLEQRLEQLDEVWAVHEKPLRNRLPLLGPALTWLGTRLARFLLQNQAIFNAESARRLQEVYQVQLLLNREQVDRGDDLLSRLEARLLALEARLQDLEAEAAQRREPV